MLLQESYQVSNNPDGPWLDMIRADTPQKALDHARAAFGWARVWVAKMRSLRAEDIAPSREMYFAEMQERVVETLGSSVNDELEEFYSAFPYEVLLDVLDKRLDSMSVDVVLPAIKRVYGTGQNVKPTDFSKPKLSDLGHE